MMGTLFAILAILGIGAAAAGGARAAAPKEPEKPTPKKVVRRITRKETPKKVVKKVPSKVKIEPKPPKKKKKVKKTKIKAKRPPTKKEKKAAKKIKETPPKEAKKVVKKLEDIVKPKKGKKPAHPIVRHEAKKKVKEVKKKENQLAKIAKFFRAVATKKFPWIWQNPKNGAMVWANKKGFEALNKAKTHKFIRFDAALATKKQKKWWADILKALAGPPKPAPTPTPKKKEEPKPLPAPAKQEIIKQVVKAETETKPTPAQAARALQLYTKEGGWQGDKSKPVQTIYDSQRYMGMPKGAEDGIIGPNTRTAAKNLGYALYRRASTAPGAYNRATPLTNRW